MSLKIEKNVYLGLATPGGGVEPGGKYQLLQRVKDDSNNEIGTVCGFIKDSNDTEYAVVVLDRAYRTSSTYNWLSSAVDVSGIPSYNNNTVYNAPETATKNCTEILATASAQSLTSGAVSRCRSKSFLIDGVTYYGQLPNLTELLYILMHASDINTLNPSGSGPLISTSYNYWSSTQNSSGSAWGISSSGAVSKGFGKNSVYNFIPVLELPNA